MAVLLPSQEGEKGTDLFFHSKTRRGVRFGVRKINLSPFLFLKMVSLKLLRLDDEHNDVA